MEFLDSASTSLDMSSSSVAILSAGLWVSFRASPSAGASLASESLLYQES